MRTDRERGAGGRATRRAVRDGDEPRPPTAIGSTIERGLLRSALDFYGAAEAVIDYRGPDRPRLRYDVAGLQAVRAAMSELEVRIRLAHQAGMSPQEIARISRLEPEVIDMILGRGDETAGSAQE